MKITTFFTAAFATLLLTATACRNDEPIVIEPKGQFENGLLIANEGGFTTPNASVAFLSKDLSKQTDDIFAGQNNNEVLGKVFQTIGFRGNLAYLVLNVPNKIEVVNRYTFKKEKTLGANLDNPRYIAFTANSTYVTNNDFFSVRKLNIYDKNDNFVKSINFDRYAEKVVAADNFVYVQTDGATYASGSAEPTGHTVTRVNAATNEVDKTLTFPDTFFVTDMVADSKFVYVLTSGTNASNLYKITASTGTYETIALPAGPAAQMLSLDQGNLYYLTENNKVFTVNGTVAKELFSVTANHAYGFDVIDGLVYVSDPSFSASSKARVYSLSGNLVKTLTTGIGTNGFFKN